MYIPGRLRTASRPSRTVMFSEPYEDCGGCEKGAEEGVTSVIRGVSVRPSLDPPGARSAPHATVGEVVSTAADPRCRRWAISPRGREGKRWCIAPTSDTRTLAFF